MCGHLPLWLLPEWRGEGGHRVKIVQGGSVVIVN